MATPIGHALAGCAIAACARRKLGLGILAFAAFAANAADLDFVPGLLAGDAGRYHHYASHTLLAGALFGAACALIAWRRCERGAALRFGALAALLYASHPLLDALSNDTGFPYGCPLFWPLSGRYFSSPRPLLLDVYRGSWAILFGPHNLAALTRELAILGSFLLGVLLVRRYRHPSAP
ncbi:MAG TPA: metal-dependent hydrolase [Acidobacteriota bacterium]